MGGSNQSLSSKRFPDILPALGHGVPIFRNNCLGLDIDLDLGNSCRWTHGCFTGLGAVLGLNLWVGAALFLFYTALSFLILGFLSGCGGLYWLVGWGIRPIFPSTSRNVCIFLIIVGWGQSLGFHRVHFINCVVLSLWTICIPCIEVIFTSTSTTSTGSQHLKYPCKKLHSGWSKQAILKCKFQFILFLVFLFPN